MAFQFVEEDRRIHGYGITHNVQVMLLEIAQLAAVGGDDIPIPDIPFVWYDPVEALCSTWDFMNSQSRQCQGQLLQGLPDAVAGNAATDREQLRGEVVAPLADSKASFDRHDAVVRTSAYGFSFSRATAVLWIAVDRAARLYP